MEKALIELPCEVGQEIYLIDNYVKTRWEIFKGRVVYFKYGKLSPRKDSEITLGIEVEKKYLTQSPENIKIMKATNIGERIFFTKEEAETNLIKFIKESEYIKKVNYK